MKFRTLTVLFSQSMFKSASGLHIVSKPFSYNIFISSLALGLFLWGGGEVGVLPYMGYIGMCRCEGYGFQAVYSRIGYTDQSVWV